MSLTNSRAPHFSTETRREYWQCERKKVYEKSRLAKQAAGTASNRSGKLIEAYKCPHCGLWHIGKPMQTGLKPPDLRTNVQESLT